MDGAFGACSATARWTSRNRWPAWRWRRGRSSTISTFIINCNLQRLDGPVRGNGQIVMELESLFKGAGWNVIKVLWGSEWDALFARDAEHQLVAPISPRQSTASIQTLGAKDGAYNLANFFDGDPEVRKLVSHMSDQRHRPTEARRPRSAQVVRRLLGGD